ncbi:MAG: D-alanyl-D-alanine carboxypeptidase/D-alanyl-D-alanine-endopeptidase [Deltaproteobacteria bacterium]|nr:D-alanyl-D-alanine carboxypeptidase/D-alanyl-D-alanine-endopeptidase [Deltaproteobacteria bacterium]
MIRVKFALLLFFLAATAEAATLSQKIDEILQHQRLLSAKVSMQIIRLSDGAILYEKDPDRLLNPASVSKLVTAAAALQILGPDYQFRTEFYTDQEKAEGVFHHLWVKGYGNPLFVTEELEMLIQTIQSKGWTKVEGDFLIDDTFFNHDHPVTYFSDESEKVYRVVTGPLSFNFNTVEIFVRPASHRGVPALIQLKPETQYFSVVNQTKTDGRRASVSSSLEVQGQRLIVEGRVPLRSRGASFRQAVSEPTLYTGTVIREAMERAGISFGGHIRREPVPIAAKPVLQHLSAPLPTLMRAMGKLSNNFVAEQLFLALGAARYGPPGVLDKGSRAAAEYLASLGVSNNYYVENGSGLSKLSRLSSNQIIAVLRELYQKRWREEAISSLSVGGIDGTLRRRFRGMLKGKVFGKTGSLNQVVSLAGYLFVEEEPVAFAFLFNDFSASPHRIQRAEEKILEAVYKEVHAMRAVR